MSWMDSWSRPSKSQATPAPFYLLPGGENTPYCRTCGRVISERKSHAKNTSATPAKYCSSKCRNRKPGKLDRQIETTFVKFLAGDEDVVIDDKSANEAKGKEKKAKKKVKGDPRILVSCDEVERVVFNRQPDPKKIFGRRKNRAARGKPDEGEWKSVDMVSDDEDTNHVSDADGSRTSADGHQDERSAEQMDGDVLARLAVRSGTRIRPSQEVSQVNGSVGGEKTLQERTHETEEMAEKRREGDRRALEREMVRCAARRGVAFGFVVSESAEGTDEKRKKCEAVMQGKVVEASFAKGDWSVRWRE